MLFWGRGVTCTCNWHHTISVGLYIFFQISWHPRINIITFCTTGVKYHYKTICCSAKNGGPHPQRNPLNPGLCVTNDAQSVSSLGLEPVTILRTRTLTRAQKATWNRTRSRTFQTRDSAEKSPRPARVRQYVLLFYAFNSQMLSSTVSVLLYSESTY